MADPAQFIFQVDPTGTNPIGTETARAQVRAASESCPARRRRIALNPESAGIGRHSKVGSTGMMPGPVVGRTQ